MVLTRCGWIAAAAAAALLAFPEPAVRALALRTESGALAHTTEGALAHATESGALADTAEGGAQATGTIRGRMEYRTLMRPRERRPSVSDHGAPPPREIPDLRRGVVYLETAPRGAFEERRAGRAVLDQRNETFVPHVLAVTAGTTVDFPNNDETFHNVFSLSRPKRFDLGRYAAGKSKSVVFDRPGVVRVFCDIHSHMSAFVLVFSHPFYQVTDAEGRFSLEHVPAGTYTVIGWYEGEPRVSRVATVPPGGVVDLELTVP